MSKKDLHLKLKEAETPLGVFRDVEVSIGRIYDDSWTEP